MARASRSLVGSDLLMLLSCVLLSLVAYGLPERLRSPLAAGLRRTLVAPLLALQHDAEASRRAWTTREQRTLVRDSVLIRSLTLPSVEAENARLRQMLGLGERLRWGFVPAEVLHSRGVGEEYTVTLSAGSRAGVAMFSPLVAPEGLVGMVRTVDPSMSIAVVWAHPDFRVSAMAADRSTYGIVAAHMADEPERFLLEMRGVPFRSSLKVGTSIVSSGLGGVFPRGIPIGTVVSELKTAEAWARTYLVRPAVLPADIQSVMILRPDRTGRGVEGVWAATVNTDSATRGVLAAADSIRSSRDTGQRGRDSGLVARDATRARRDTTGGGVPEE